MKIAVCYVAVANGRITEDFAARFVATYKAYPAGTPHDLFIISNGGPLKNSVSLIFEGIECKMFVRSNQGWDIGGYIESARGPCRDYDMMVCLGESVHFHHQGWLSRLVEAWEKYGPGMYGPFASNLVRAHLGTTAFCCHPLMLIRYHKRVSNKAERYEFEHGESSLWRRLYSQGTPVKLVTWDGEWEPRMWRAPKNILWRGDQSNCIMLCSHTDNYEKVDSKTKARWARNADKPFK